MSTASHPPLSQSELEVEFLSRPGLIPIQIDPQSDTIVWADLEQFHAYHGFFANALNEWVSIRGAAPVCYSTSVDVLESIRIPLNSLAPTGFIFHAGRCGSTLLAQVLARSRRNMVFGEAAPHNQIWHCKLPTSNSADLSEPDPAHEGAYRNLLLAMGRRRLPSYISHIVKFTSFNILKFHQIRASFPGVPVLFLFRKPNEVLDSYHRNSPSWMGTELGFGQSFAAGEAAVAAFFRAALSIEDPDFRCLDYARLTPDTLSSILAFFRLDPDNRELRRMIDGFSWDAKSAGTSRAFFLRENRSPTYDRAANLSGELHVLYQRLTTWQPL